MKQVRSPNKTKYQTNKKKFIILHHTWGGTMAWNVSRFQNPISQVSAHYIVGRDGEVVKFNTHDDILWHCWSSKININWKIYYDLNRSSIGIEIINGEEEDGEERDFTDAQRKAVDKLIQSIMKDTWIPHTHIKRHKDIAPWRKVDIYDEFWNNQYSSFTDYINTFKSYNNKMTDKERDRLILNLMNDCSSVYNNLQDEKFAEIRNEQLLLMKKLNDNFRKVWYKND